MENTRFNNSIYPFIDYLQGRGIKVEPDGNGRWKCLCPLHDDHDESLKIRVKNDWIQVTCFGGCLRSDVFKVLDVSPDDLCLDSRKLKHKERTERIDYDYPDAVYDYTDAEGNLRYQSLRYQQGGKRKTFRQRRPNPDDPGKPIWNIEGIEHYLYGLPDLAPAIERDEIIYYTEGEKDRNNLRKLGVMATTHSGGAKAWEDSLIKYLAGADVVFIPDKDVSGISLLQKVSKAAPGIVKRLRILPMPGDAHDSSDWIDEGHNKADLEGITETAQDCTPELVAELVAVYKSTLSELVVTNRHMRDITTEALATLQKRNSPARLFRRSDTLTRVAWDETNKPYTEDLSEAAFRGELDRCCNFVRFNLKGDTVPIPPPLEVVRDGMTRPNEWQFPSLLGITETPVIRPDGTILDKPGYDEATKLYYSPAPELEIPPIPDKVTDSHLQDAADRIIEPLCDFPFDSEASWCNAIGTMLAPILRPMITGPVPMALFDKPQQGTGATLLAEAISTIATGRPAAMMTAPADDEGWRKAITSLLRKGQMVCTVDNIEGDLQSSALAALLTSLSWQDRILGISKMIELPHRAIWIATGNNINLKGDLPRRCLWIRMDAQVARPWMRKLKDFSHPDLRDWLVKNRGIILASVLTIAREWMKAQKPTPDDIPILGGFESYCKVINGVLSFIGARKFLGNLDDMYNETDTETPQWENFLEVWHGVLKEEGYTAAQLIGYINDYTELRDALPDALAYIMEGKKEKNYGVRLGQKLKHFNGRQYPNRCVLRKSGTKQRAVTWQVVRVELATTSPKFSLQSEVSEVSPTLTCGEKKDGNDKVVCGGGVGLTSPTSPPVTKKSEVAKETPVARTKTPTHPKAPCRCGCDKFWLRPPLPKREDSEWVCTQCHKIPKGLEPAIYTVPPRKPKGER